MNADPMPTIIDTLHGAAALHKAEVTARAAWVDRFEAHAETHDDKYWIPVETAADLVVDADPIRTAQVEVVRHVEAIIRLCYPDDMTPNVTRMFTRALGEYNS